MAMDSCRGVDADWYGPHIGKFCCELATCLGDAGKNVGAMLGCRMGTRKILESLEQQHPFVE